MKKIRAEGIGQLLFDLADERQVGRPGSCSAKHVRDVRPVRLGVPSVAGIAKGNKVCTLQVRGDHGAEV